MQVFILKGLHAPFCTKIVQEMEVLQIKGLRRKGLPKSKNASEDAGRVKYETHCCPARIIREE